MNNYLKIFKTHENYEYYKEHVSYDNEVVEAHCVKEVEMHDKEILENMYLTFTPIDEAMTFSFSGTSSGATKNKVSYSLDKGTTWIELQDGEETPLVEANQDIC